MVNRFEDGKPILEGAYGFAITVIDAVPEAFVLEKLGNG